MALKFDGLVEPYTGCEGTEEWDDFWQNPEDMANPNIDEKRMKTCLSYFPDAQCKHGAPLGQNKQLTGGNVKVYGPALELQHCRL